MFLTGFGYVYVDIAHQCGTVIITVAPEGKAGPILTGIHRWVCRPSSNAASVFRNVVNLLVATLVVPTHKLMFWVNYHVIHK